MRMNLVSGGRLGVWPAIAGSYKVARCQRELDLIHRCVRHIDSLVLHAFKTLYQQNTVNKKLNCHANRVC